jgi:hypothetical protein
MKKLLLLCVLLIGMINLYAEDQPRENEPNVSVQVNAFDYLFWAWYPDQYRIVLEVQYAFTNYFTISLEPHFQFTKTTEFRDEHSTFEDPIVENDVYDYGIKSGVLFKPAGNFLRGAYIGIFLDLSIVSRTYKNQNLLGVGNCFEAGCQWVFKNGITLSLGGGLTDYIYIPLYKSDYSYSNSKYSMSGWSIDDIPLPVWARISVGYSFYRGKK